MLDRRSFLGNSLLLNLFPFLSFRGSDKFSESSNLEGRISSDFIATLNYSRKKSKLFIAHRGVHINNTIAGENSLEAIRFAKRAYFDAVEFDIRQTKDSHWVVMHDETINRTVLNNDGTELSQPTKVSEVTLESLKRKFVLRCLDERYRSTIPTLSEFLVQCKQSAVLPFIEIKPHNLSDKIYIDLIREIDEIVGRGNYVITSNNEANETIRRIGLSYVTLMGILYQTTFKRIEDLGNIIMAISTSRFNLSEYEANVRHSNRIGMVKESSANNFDQFTQINDYGIEIVSTDILTAELPTGINLLKDVNSDISFEDFKYTGKIHNGFLKLKNGDFIELDVEPLHLYFGGLFLEVVISGRCEVELLGQRFSIENDGWKSYDYQLIVHNKTPSFSLVAAGDCVVKYIRIKIVKY